MPTKLNRAGKPQNYVPSGNGDISGEYTDGQGQSKSFNAFKKQDSGFESANKQRLGNMPSSQPKKIAEPKLTEPEDYDSWEKSIMTQTRVGNPPQELKIRLKDTPIHVSDEEERQAIAKEFGEETANAAFNLLKKYEKSVDITAGDLERIADKNGGIMIGMEFRLKRMSSMSRKLQSYVNEEHAAGNTNFGINDAVNKMRDVARFTMVFNENDFQNGVNQAINSLKQQGYQLARAKNTFTEGADYKGLNCNFIDKNGNIFELQFHVPSSIQIKEGINIDLQNKKANIDRRNVTSHDIYEKSRVLEDKIKTKTITPSEKKLYDDLIRKSKERWAKVPNYEFNL